MPIICNVPLPSDDPSEDSSAKVDIYGNLTTQRNNPRFTGVHTIHDGDGNIYKVSRPETQPSFWATGRGWRVGRINLVSM